MADIGALRERLTLQQDVSVPVALTSLTRVGSTATAVSAAAHGFTSRDYVTIAGATQTAYNGRVQVTVVDTVTFTYAVAGAPATPAAGTITATYASDAQGGRVPHWADAFTVSAELLPVRAIERLQLAAIQATVDVRFRVRRRADIVDTMRAQWTPVWPHGSSPVTLQITGVLIDDDVYALLECTAAGT